MMPDQGAGLQGNEDGLKLEFEPATTDHASANAQTTSTNAEDEPLHVDDFGLPIRKGKARNYDENEEEHELSGDIASVDHTDPADVHRGIEPAPSSTAVNVAEVDEDGLRGIAMNPGLAPAPAPAPAHAPELAAAESQASALVTDIVMQSQHGLGLRDINDVDKDIVHRRAHSDEHGTTSTHKGKAAVSEWSHQQLAPHEEEVQQEGDDDDWQDMPAFATHTIYDDWGKVLAREEAELDEQEAAYGHLGGAGKGYTKVQLDEDAQSATSMDDNTAYLFKGAQNTLDEDEEGRDVLSQMQTTKQLLTEGQRIAYVGLARLSMIGMIKEIDGLERTKGAKKQIDTSVEAAKMWSQKMMVRLYAHMDISPAEQIMIEQLADHGVEPGDLTPALMQNAHIKNPAADNASSRATTPDLPRSTSTHPSSRPQTPQINVEYNTSPSGPMLGLPRLSSAQSSPRPSSRPSTPRIGGDWEPASEPGPSRAPPPYEEENPPDYLDVKRPSDVADEKNLDIDLRWTVLCDLFLVLIADSIYDSRSRTLLEKVGSALSVPWLEICRFEKRVTDALEMQEAADKENWNEDTHLKDRKKSYRKRRLVMMGLVTVGGGLVIGLSAGLLAPVIGAGLAAGFTTIGVAGTSSFLAGAGGAALITSTGVLTGGTIAVRAGDRRFGSVKTYEYRPLHNNKRVNLIVTVAGWMTGKVDDIRLPYSTVDPIMGDVYSVFWEPEMLQSMGDTINILATEALTQGLQQILGSTILITLMAAIQLPVVLTKLAYLIDNPWSVSLARADSTGLILADSLIDRNLGVRPVTLVGFSLGARVIFSCLRELANRGAYGLVQNVYVYGSPVVVKKDDYLRARTIVSGRFVNGYATNDWILGYLFRATSGGIMRVAGLAPVEIPGIENHDVTELVPGHMAYRAAMPKLLREVGWVVESLEFQEIEDPDPENHVERQRELINEIEEARRKLETKPSKRGLRGLFSRNKKDKKEWETYDEQARASADGAANGSAEGAEMQDGAVLFDIDAIRREAVELAAQGIELKEIKSTLPPMKITMSNDQFLRPGAARPDILRHSQSYNSGLLYRGSKSTESLHSRDSGRMTPPDINGHNAAASSASRPYHYDVYDEDQGPHDEGEVSMTFDSPDRPRGAQTWDSGHRQASQTWDPTEQQRPPLQTTASTPNTPQQHGWADVEEEHSMEQDVSMSFE